MVFVALLSVLMPLLGILLVVWLVTTLNSINRNVADIARHLGRVEGRSEADRTR